MKNHPTLMGQQHLIEREAAAAGEQPHEEPAIKSADSNRDRTWIGPTGERRRTKNGPGREIRASDDPAGRRDIAKPPEDLNQF
jgi:hypothetical protein